MAAPVYASDLVEITTAAIEQATTNWTSINGASATLGANETDQYIVGTNSFSKTAGTATSERGMIYNAGAKTITTPAAIFAWINYLAVPDLATEASGGLRILVGSSTAAYKEWYVGGSDNYQGGAGGWINVAVDPSLTADNTVGSPTTTLSAFGYTVVCPTSNPSKGNPQALNRIRYGRVFTATNGDLANGYCTFSGAATVNDSTGTSPPNARWGQFANQGGYYLQKGLFSFGSAATAVDFRDSNASIFIQNTKKVASTFNGWEVHNASSNLALTNISFQALGTVSPGYWTVVDNATVALTGCSFVNMGAFGFLANSTLTGCVFNNCGQITMGGGKLLTTAVSNYNGTSDTAAVVINTASDTDGRLDGSTFTKGTPSTHAIQLGTSSPTTVTLRNITFSGYNAANGNTDSTILVSRTTGTVTINLVGCSGNISYKSAGATVSLVVNPVTTSVHVQDAATGAALQNARVFLAVTSNVGGFPYNMSVTSITNSSTTATVTTSSAHGLSTNDLVWIKGASLAQNNGCFAVTVTGTTTFTYTMVSAPGSNPTGTITCTYVVIGSDATTGGGVTDASGNISSSKSWLSNQPVSGHVRDSSGAPYYQNANISGTISSTSGLSITAQMVLDQ